MAQHPPRTDFASKLAAAAAAGIEATRQLEALANDYADLGYGQALTAEDLVGTLEGLTPEQVAACMAGVVALGVLLSSNEAAYRKAFKTVAQYAR